jgi:hypothetical protein
MTASPDEISFLPLRWENFAKQRYYQIFLARDLFGDWVVTKAWGSLNTAAGRVTHVACSSLEEAKILIEKITHTRKNRGYIPR